jgi:hypothetical protein
VRAWLALFLLLAGPALGQALPVFSMDGHDAVAHGRERGYPVPGAAPQARRQPFMVGGFSHFEALLDARRVPRPAVASGLARAERELVLSYVHRGERQTIDSYLERHPATGLLVLRDGVILLERYRYGRRDTHRFTSQCASSRGRSWGGRRSGRCCRWRADWRSARPMTAATMRRG